MWPNPVAAIWCAKSVNAMPGYIIVLITSSNQQFGHDLGDGRFDFFLVYVVRLRRQCPYLVWNLAGILAKTTDLALIGWALADLNFAHFSRMLLFGFRRHVLIWRFEDPKTANAANTHERLQSQMARRHQWGQHDSEVSKDFLGVDRKKVDRVKRLRVLMC